jgi:hypothetical protein
MNKGSAYDILKRSGRRKRRAEKLEVRQAEDLCDRRNVTAV